MKWLITGGCGFIGRALIHSLLHDEDDHFIRVYDDLSVGSREDLRMVAKFVENGNWDNPLALVEGDIRESEKMVAAVKGADVVVHLAANTGVGPSVKNPRMDCEVNVLGVLTTLEACRTANTSLFVFASSGAPLGVQTPPLHEEMAPHPASPYGASKLAGEGYCSAYFHSFGIDTVTLRFGNVYGEGSARKTSVVAEFIKRALDGETLEIYGDGSQTRDFIHISDLIRAIKAAATKEGVGGETFQVATSSETTVAELTEALVDALAVQGIARPKVVNGKKRTGDVARNFSNTSKAARMLNWQAEVSLESGLERTVRFFVETYESEHEC